MAFLARTVRGRARPASDLRLGTAANAKLADAAAASTDFGSWQDSACGLGWAWLGLGLALLLEAWGSKRSSSSRNLRWQDDRHPARDSRQAPFQALSPQVESSHDVGKNSLAFVRGIWPSARQPRACISTSAAAAMASASPQNNDNSVARPHLPTEIAGSKNSSSNVKPHRQSGLVVSANLQLPTRHGPPAVGPRARSG